MSIIKPTFPDGVPVKTDDLQRILDYTRMVEQGILRYFGPGIIYAPSISYIYTPGISPNPNTITVTVKGPCLISAENKELISLDANQTLEGTFVYPADNTGVDIYIYESNIVVNTSRQNLANIPRPVSEVSVYSLSDSLPSPTTPGKLAKIATIVNPNTPVTYKSIVTLQHTDTFVDGVYTGPILDANASLKDLSVTNSKLANGSVTTTKIANGSVTTTKIVDGAVTSTKIADGSISINHLSTTQPIIGTSNIMDNSITTSKIADKAVTMEKIDLYLPMNIPVVVKFPTLYVIPTQTYSDPQTYGTPAYLWDFLQVNPFNSAGNFRFLGLNNWILHRNSLAPAYLQSWTGNHTMADKSVRDAHQEWLNDIAKLSYTELGNTTSSYNGGVNGNILWNISDIKFHAFYVIDITKDKESNKGVCSAAYLPYALKISSVIPHSVGLPQYLVLHGPVLVRISNCRISNSGSVTNYITVHTPFIIAPNGYRILSVSFSSQHNVSYTSESYSSESYSSVLHHIQTYTQPYSFHTSWDVPLPAYIRNGNPLSSPGVRGMCVKCMSLLHSESSPRTFYDRFTEEAPMMSVSMTLEKIHPNDLSSNSSDLPILLKEPVTGAFVWKSTI